LLASIRSFFFFATAIARIMAAGLDNGKNRRQREDRVFDASRFSEAGGCRDAEVSARQSQD
jgi:hypothetical protein